MNYHFFFSNKKRIFLLISLILGGLLTLSFDPYNIPFFSLIANLGFSTTHRKKISEGKDLGRCIGTYFTIRISLAFIWITSLLIWIYYSKIKENFIFDTKESEYVLYIVISYVFIS